MAKVKASKAKIQASLPLAPIVYVNQNHECTTGSKADIASALQALIPKASVILGHGALLSTTSGGLKGIYINTESRVHTLTIQHPTTPLPLLRTPMSKVPLLLASLMVTNKVQSNFAVTLLPSMSITTMPTSPRLRPLGEAITSSFVLVD